MKRLPFGRPLAADHPRRGIDVVARDSGANFLERLS
jgi:hypothetical protein